jgi:hypothetical protein
LAGEPRLDNLVSQYGPAKVWNGGVKLFGFPPTLDVSSQGLLRLADFLEENQRKGI